MQVIRQRDLVETPWKNGGGITRHIAQEGDASSPLWRLSMADVDEDGRFSRFPGLTRILTVIKGDGMTLHGPDGDLLARYAEPVTFEGAMPVMATLRRGPIRVLNLMFDAARCQGEVHVVRKAGANDFGQSGQTCVLHVIAGQAQVDGDNLRAGDTVIGAAKPLCFDLVPDSVALAITLGLKG